MTDLAHARAVIEAETCELSGGFNDWCQTHRDACRVFSDRCDSSPADLLTVARDLLAIVERVEALADEAHTYGPDEFGTPKRKRRASRTPKGDASTEERRV